MTHRPLLDAAHAAAAAYLDALPGRHVAPSAGAVAALSALDRPLPEAPTDPLLVLHELDTLGSPATVATAGGRYFGFVNGATLPAALAAAWLASAWDQNAALAVMSPAGASRVTPRRSCGGGRGGSRSGRRSRR